MNRVPLARLTRAGLLLAGTAVFAGCADTLLPPSPGDGITAAAGGGGKPTTGPSVTTANPAYGNGGEVSKQVTITGSGFAPGAQAAWERGGVPDVKVQVVSTQYISPTQVVATINIAPDASIDLYNLSVTNPDKKKGIGYALFEVTQAVVTQAVESVQGVNDAGDMTGGPNPAIYFNPTSGLEVVNATGKGWAVSQPGNSIVGVGDAFPRLWNKVGPAWQATSLPTDPSATGGRASSLSADVSGQVVLIGGLEIVPTGKHSSTQLPRLWSWQAATSDWARISLPTGTTNKGDVLGVSDNGVAVGWIVGSAFQAAAWESSGSGYSLTAIAPGGSRAMGINSAGTLIVGASGGSAAYWERLPGGGWSSPITLPGGCGIAKAVDNAGRIVANSCPDGNRSSPAVFAPPYSTTTMIRLSGLGPSLGGYAEGMSPSGNYVVGEVVNGGTSIGVYWKLF
jgi:hypothetical protein